MSRPRKRWSEADLQDARALYESGLSFAQLGRELGYSATWLARVFKKAGVPVRPSGRPYTSAPPPVDLAELKELRESGWTYTELAARYGIRRDRSLQVLPAGGSTPQCDRSPSAR